MKVFLSRAHYPVTTLGPGKRVAIWFQGCSIRCEGCISVDTWAPGRGETTVEAILSTVDAWLCEADGLTVSGGEPFDQPEALRALLTEIRRHYRLDILVYTGYPIEQLNLASYGNAIDALISDPYKKHMPQTLPIRGSDNQRLHLLSDLGKSRFRSFITPGQVRTKSLELIFGDDGVAWMAGIPVPGDFARLEEVMSHAGHHAVTSRDKSQPQ
jgi:anaerobic ribonucleoside-triphosphate reductase activating protein